MVHAVLTRQTMAIVWHYTTGEKFALILADGEIVPATEGLDVEQTAEFIAELEEIIATGGAKDVAVPYRERPAVWFSKRQTWEPTATKGIYDARMRENLNRGLTSRHGSAVGSRHAQPRLQRLGVACVRGCKRRLWRRATTRSLTPSNSATPSTAANELVRCASAAHAAARIQMPGSAGHAHDCWFWPV